MHVFFLYKNLLHQLQYRCRGHRCLFPSNSICSGRRRRAGRKASAPDNSDGLCVSSPPVKIIGISRAETVCAVAGDPGSGGIGRHPLTPQGKINNDRRIHITHFAPHIRLQSFRQHIKQFPMYKISCAVLQSNDSVCV